MGVRGEQQLTFMGRDKKDIDTDLIQFRVSVERKRDFQLYCKQKGFSSMSSCLNLIIAKLLDDARTMPDPRTLAPIEDALKTLKEAIPLFERYGHKNFHNSYEK